MAKRKDILQLLNGGGVLMLDGSLGDDLRIRGADATKGQSFTDDESLQPTPNGLRDHQPEVPEDGDVEAQALAFRSFLRNLGPWSAPMNIDSPGLVHDVHADHLRAGADVVMTNNFWTSPSQLARIGLGDDWERYARAAVRLAIETRDALRPDAYVAGVFAPSPVAEDLEAEFEAVARVLADEGVDLLLPEYLGTISECVTAARACCSVGPPVFLAVRHVTADGTLQFGESFDSLAAALVGLPIAGLLIMCSAPEAVSASLPVLRAAFDGPIGVYPNNPAGPSDEEPTEEDVERFAQYAGEWLAAGAQMVGGCCGVRSPHLRALAPIIEQHRHASSP